MNTELIREIKENVYKILELFIGTELVVGDSLDNYYMTYRKAIMDELYKYKNEFSETTNDDYIDFKYKIDFTVGKNRIIEDITVVFQAPECIAVYVEIE